MRWWAGVGCILVSGTLILAQPSAEVPPLSLPTAVEAVGLPNGTLVSRPLQPVLQPPAPAPVAPVLIETSFADVPIGPLGRTWSMAEYLLWWPQPSPTVLASPLDPSPVSGGRFTLGGSVDADDQVGTEVTYLFTGSRTATNTVVRVTERTPLDQVTESWTNRITGWELNGLANLSVGPNWRVHALAGYRYLMVNEGVRLDSLTGSPTTLVGAAHQFDAHNRFHGGQLGLFTDYEHGALFVQAVGKLALGQATTVVRVSGQSIALTPGLPLPTAQVMPHGVFGPAGYPVRVSENRFAVLPEATVKLGCRLRNQARVYLGYNFLYLSEAVRAAEQIQTVGPPVSVADFWVQGLLFGLEHRY